MLIIVGCEVKRPKDVIAPEILEDILYDYHLAQIMANDASGLQYKKKLYTEYVFRKHGYTQQEFDSSMVWYARNPKHMFDLYSSLQERIDAEVAALDNEDAAIVALPDRYLNADSVNLWRGLRVELLSSTPYKNKFYFDYEADTTFVSGDSVILSMNSRFIPRDTAVIQTAYMAMILDYDNSTSVSSGHNMKDGEHIITFARDVERKIKNIRAFVYYIDDDTAALSRLLLGDIKLMRIHPKKAEE